MKVIVGSKVFDSSKLATNSFEAVNLGGELARDLAAKGYPNPKILNEIKNVICKNIIIGATDYTKTYK